MKEAINAGTGAGVGEPGNRRNGTSVNIAKSPAGDQPSGPDRHDQIVGEQGSPLEADAQIEAELPVDLIGQQRGPDRVGGVETDMVGVRKDPGLRRQLEK